LVNVKTAHWNALDPSMHELLIGAYGVPSRSGLSIREAKWISHLYPLLQQIATNRPKDREEIMDFWLFFLADIYTRLERVCQKLEIDFDTFGLDDRYFISQTFWDLPPGDKIVDVLKAHGIDSNLNLPQSVEQREEEKTK